MCRNVYIFIFGMVRLYSIHYTANIYLLIPCLFINFPIVTDATSHLFLKKKIKKISCCSCCVFQSYFQHCNTATATNAHIHWLPKIENHCIVCINIYFINKIYLKNTRFAASEMLFRYLFIFFKQLDR